MIPATSIFNRPRSGRAFSLIEVMVAVTLMSVIVLGLLAMFSQTQRAFRSGVTQVDVMESGRAACEMLAREMEQMTPTGLPNTANFWVERNPAYVFPQSLPGTDSSGQPQWRTNILDNIFFFTRENRNWQGVLYQVESPNYVGTLYRYETNVANLDLSSVVYERERPTSVDKFRTVLPFQSRRSQVIDGVVHLRVLAYDSNGALITPEQPYVIPYGLTDSIGVTNTISDPRTPFRLSPELNLQYHFRSNAVPAYLELELGILEQKTAERCRNLDLALQPKFLESKAGNVQIFRQRIAIRNVQPSVYQ